MLKLYFVSCSINLKLRTCQVLTKLATPERLDATLLFHPFSGENKPESEETLQF